MTLNKLYRTSWEQMFPRINPMPDQDGIDECPNCHGRGTMTERNYATLSPSDDYERVCELCGGAGKVLVVEPEEEDDDQP